MSNIQFGMPTDLHKVLKARAKRENRTMVSVLREIITGDSIYTAKEILQKLDISEELQIELITLLAKVDIELRRKS